MGEAAGNRLPVSLPLPTNAFGLSPRRFCQEPALVWVIHFPLKHDLSTAFPGIKNDHRGQLTARKGGVSSHLCSPENKVSAFSGRTSRSQDATLVMSSATFLTADGLASWAVWAPGINPQGSSPVNWCSAWPRRSPIWGGEVEGTGETGMGQASCFQRSVTLG